MAIGTEEARLSGARHHGGMPIELTTLTEARVDEWVRVMSRGFGAARDGGGDHDAEGRAMELDRSIAALDGEQIVGTATAYSMEMTVPGGATIDVGAVSGVTVSMTHRRQGILTDMMRQQLDDVAGRGESIAILNASEAGIYERFGYGLAQLYSVVELWRDRAAFAYEPPQVPLRMIHQEEAAAVLAPIWDAWRPTRAGAVSHNEAWWDCLLSTEESWKGGGNLHVVVADGGVPEASGFATYRIGGHSDPRGWTVHVRELVAADAAVEARLWQHLLGVDLASKVIADARPVDDPLRWRLTDPRQYRTNHLRDYLFVRILDVPAALASRQYESAGELVLEVVDAFRPQSGGRFVLRVDEAGDAVSEPTTAAADLVLTQAELGSLLLGGVRARDLALAGRLQELTPGAIVAADVLFSWPVAPFCATRF